jgi:hypothetical protein
VVSAKKLRDVGLVIAALFEDGDGLSFGCAGLKGNDISGAEISGIICAVCAAPIVLKRGVEQP